MVKGLLMKKQKKLKIVPIIVVALVCYFAYTAFCLQGTVEDRKQEGIKLQQNIAEELRKKEQLEQQKNSINTPAFAEKIAREKLGYVKDGEVIYVDTNK